MVQVRLIDGVICVNGPFQEAKNFVKSCEGRSWHADTKEWEVPTSVQEFMTTCPFSVDVLSSDAGGKFSPGTHKTRYGNYYSQDEWQAYIEINEAKAQISEQYIPAFQGLEQSVLAELQAIHVKPDVITLLSRHRFDIYDLEERGTLRYSSTHRQHQLHCIIDAYFDAVYALTERQAEEETAIEEMIYKQHGIL